MQIAMKAEHGSEFAVWQEFMERIQQAANDLGIEFHHVPNIDEEF